MKKRRLQLLTVFGDLLRPSRFTPSIIYAKVPGTIGKTSVRFSNLSWSCVAQDSAKVLDVDGVTGRDRRPWTNCHIIRETLIAKVMTTVTFFIFMEPKLT